MNYNGLKEDKRLVKAVPSARQIAYENMEFFCFIHFTVNTFTGSEWGDGTEPESIFNPTELDARQWAKTAAGEVKKPGRERKKSKNKPRRSQEAGA